MNWTLYHNPKCGSSRKTLERLEAKGIKPRIVEYLKTPPTVNELEEILRKLGTGPEEITRFKESVWEEKGGASMDRAAWLKLIAENPILLQRPIVVRGDKAVVARPPEKVDALF